MLCLSLAAGCGEQTDVVTTTTPVAELGETASCDAGDQAFVRRLIPLMYGRHPTSIYEVQVLVDVIKERGRDALVRAMAQSPEYRWRWEQMLKDHLWVPRAGERAFPSCYGERVMEPDGGELAESLRLLEPEDPGGDPWTMLDLMHSSLALDDLSPLFIAQLFAQQGTGRVVVVSDPFDEEQARENYANIFQRSYLGRRMSCLPCHNSEFSVTGPRTHAVPGLYERSLFGASTGMARAQLTAFFQSGGVIPLEELPHVAGAPADFEMLDEGVAPWGMAYECGRFESPEDIGEDIPQQTGYLGGDYAAQSSVWDLVTLARSGFAAIRGGYEVPTEVTAEVSPDVSLAWMTSTNFVEAVWTEATGNGLTLSHGFPRNAEQRAIKQSLAETFVAAEFSLVELLVAVTGHELFNQALPEACAAAESPYHLPPVFAPFTPDSDDPDVRLNGVGDTIRRMPPRLMLHAAEAALGWTQTTEFFSSEDIDTELEDEEANAGDQFFLPDAARLQRDLGVFLKDTELGFRGLDFQTALTWEHAAAACRSPNDPEGTADVVDDLLSQGLDYERRAVGVEGPSARRSEAG